MPTEPAAEAEEVPAGMAAEPAPAAFTFESLELQPAAEEAAAPAPAETPAEEFDFAALAAAVPAEAAPVQEAAQPEEEPDVVVGSVSLSPALFAIYVGEAEQHAATLEREMAAIEADPLHPVSHEFMRAAHTLTSSSRTTGFFVLADVAHALEKWITDAIDYPPEFTPARIATTRRAVDGVVAMVRSIAGRPSSPLPDLPDWDDATRLANEKATLGFYVSGHPLASWKGLLDDFASHGTGALKSAESGIEVSIGGLVTELRKRKSKKGAWWASFQIEDMEGQVEILAFPKTFDACQDVLENGRAVLVTGRLTAEEGRVRIGAEDVVPLEDLRERKAGAVQLRLDADEIDDALIEGLRRSLQRHRGEVALYLEIVRPGDYRLLARAEPGLKVRPSRELAASSATWRCRPVLGLLASFSSASLSALRTTSSCD